MEHMNTATRMDTPSTQNLLLSSPKKNSIIKDMIAAIMSTTSISSVIDPTKI